MLLLGQFAAAQKDWPERDSIFAIPVAAEFKPIDE